MRVLEIGPDKIPSSCRKIVGDDSITWHTLDIIDNPKLTFSSSDEYSFPIPDNSYDIVFCAQVLEHVKKIWLWVREVARVCKAGGHVIMICPLSWPYHEAPVDCWRVYPEGIRTLYEEGDLEVVTATFESLEFPGYTHYIPGKSLTHRGWRRQVAHFTMRLLLGKEGFPVERAYDTIAIGRKVRG